MVISSEFYSSGTVPLRVNPERVLTAKILLALNNQASGSGTGTGTFSGTGSPEGVITASPGSTYTDTGSSPVNFWTKTSGTGNTGWTQIIGS